nr:4,5:9,10-diseco-3-hydroxy-5,9,17-trioxoandrosta-1(10),2-diene-4-oate hydrolase-like [Nerophis lumbriciformis]
MAARTRDEEHRQRRRKRLIRGLLMGSAAIGVPALANLLVRQRARQLPAATWGSGDRYAWRHGEVVFQCLGEGSPLLLLHSLGPGHGCTEWRQTAELLAENHQVFALDLLGWGESSKPILAYDDELYIHLLTDFLTDVVGGRAALAAAGLPAAYALQLAVDRPELVRCLALVVPQGIELHGDEPDLKDAVVHRLLKLPIVGTSAMNLYTSRSGIGNYLRREVYGSPVQVNEALIDQHYRISHEDGAQAPLAALLSGYLNHNVRSLLSRVEQPAWLAWGRRAVSPPVESADLWLRQLANADLEVFERCGSLPHAESPEEFSRKLDSFLGEQAG